MINNTAVYDALTKSEEAASKIHTLSLDVTSKTANSIKACKELYSLVEQLNKMTRDAKLLALNAEIESSRGSTELHRTFSVISKELAKFSISFHTILETIDTLVTDIYRSAGDDYETSRTLSLVAEEQTKLIVQILQNLGRN